MSVQDASTVNQSAEYAALWQELAARNPAQASIVATQMQIATETSTYVLKEALAMADVMAGQIIDILV